MPTPDEAPRRRFAGSNRPAQPSTLRIMLALTVGLGFVAVSLWLPLEGSLYVGLSAAGLAAGLVLPRHALSLGLALGVVVAIPLVAYELFTRNATLRHPLVPLVQWGELLQVLILLAAPVAGAALAPGALRSRGATRWGGIALAAGLLVGVGALRSVPLTTSISIPTGQLTELVADRAFVDFSVAWNGPGWLQVVVFAGGRPIAVSEFEPIVAPGEYDYSFPCTDALGLGGTVLDLVLITAGGADMPTIQEGRIANSLGTGPGSQRGAAALPLTAEGLEDVLGPRFEFILERFESR